MTPTTCLCPLCSDPTATPTVCGACVAEAAATTPEREAAYAASYAALDARLARTGALLGAVRGAL